MIILNCIFFHLLIFSSVFITTELDLNSQLIRKWKHFWYPPIFHFYLIQRIEVYDDSDMLKKTNETQLISFSSHVHHWIASVVIKLRISGHIDLLLARESMKEKECGIHWATEVGVEVFQWNWLLLSKYYCRLFEINILLFDFS